MRKSLYGPESKDIPPLVPDDVSPAPQLWPSRQSLHPEQILHKEKISNFDFYNSLPHLSDQAVPVLGISR
jgi:hypothetical protein